MTDRDAIFAARRERAADFDFGARTASVFDDMLDRSVPYYAEIQRMTAELARDFAKDDTSIYDLGCATGASILAIAEGLAPERRLRFVGVDSSQEMLDRAREKLTPFAYPYALRRCDLERDPLIIESASVVLLVLTLQFVRPLYREALIANIARSLPSQGALIVVEKVIGESSIVNRLFIEHYYDLKRRNGYSDLEIAQKREALENFLVPYRLEENRELLRLAGFRSVDVFFKWYNFCGIVAVK